MDRRGISLIELIVSFTITAVLVSFLMSIVFIGSRGHQKILRRQGWISKSLLFRNILESHVLFLNDSIMNDGDINFKGNPNEIFFQSLQESSKGILKRNFSLSFLNLSHRIRLLIVSNDSPQQILIQKEMSHVEDMSLSYFDSKKRVWINQWTDPVFYPSAFCVKIKHKFFKEPIVFIMDIFYGKS